MFIFIVYIVMLMSVIAIVKIVMNHYEETRELILENYNLEKNFKLIINLLFVVILSASLILFNSFCCN